MGVKSLQQTSSLFLISSREFFLEQVENGLQKRNVKTDPSVQKYLVDLLEHYLDARNLFDQEISESGKKQFTTLAEMYLHAHTVESWERIELLKKLGDRSLYISGFFGDSLQRKLVDVDYYAGIGGAAYANLADAVREESLSIVYRTFSERFIDYVDVLTYISQQSLVHTDSSLLRLYDRYMRTGSELAKEKLVEMGVLTVQPDQVKLSRQD